MTPGDSAKNLREFMDQLVAQHSGPGSLVMTPNGERVKGLYHKLRHNEHSAIEGALSWFFAALTGEITSNGSANHSAGMYFSIEGAGRGQCEIVPKKIGPFLSDNNT